jgi:hypothetical protein
LIISIDTEKAFDMIQHYFMIKPLRKLGIEGMYINIIEATNGKPIANIILNETRMSTLPTPIQHSSGILNQSNKARRRNKRNTNRKKKIVKVSLFADNMILYLKTQKNST